MFMPLTVTQGMMVHFMTVSLTIWLGFYQLIIRHSLSLLVMPMLITPSGWCLFSPTDRHGRDALDFVICQVVSSWCAVLLTLLVIDSIW